MKIIWSKVINCHHNDPLASHFGIHKTRKLIARKYFWLIFCQDVEAYVKGCNVCLALKIVYHKLYENLQSLPVPTYCWKNLSIDFMTGQLLLIDKKNDSYNVILVIANCLTKIVHYKPVKIIIDITGLVEVIINMVIKHYGLRELIISNLGSLFTSKFWYLLCYFLGIK